MTPKQQRFCQEYMIDLNATQAAIRAGYSLPFISKADEFYVYFLIDSGTSEIFYVGKGVKNRAFSHVKNHLKSFDQNPKKNGRISKILASGNTVEHRLFADGLNEDGAYQLEKEAIFAIGLDRLTNVNPGYMSKVERDLVYAEQLIQRMIPLHTWCALKERTDAEVQTAWRFQKALWRIRDELLLASKVERSRNGQQTQEA